MSQYPVTREKVLMTSAARTASPTAVEFICNEHRGVMLFVDVTTGAATPSVTPAVETRVPGTSNWVQCHANFAAITSTSAARYSYLIYPGLEETEGTGGMTQVENYCIGRRNRVTMTHGDADSLTYSVAIVLLP